MRIGKPKDAIAAIIAVGHPILFWLSLKSFFLVEGMEGNVFGFMFALPLAILSLVVGILELGMFFKRKI